jgi:hypothetical protein
MPRDPVLDEVLWRETLKERQEEKLIRRSGVVKKVYLPTEKKALDDALHLMHALGK